MSGSAVVWHGTLQARDDRPGTSAWVLTLGDLTPASRIAPTDRDRRDIGARKGEDARRFLARRAALRWLVGRRCDVPPETVEIGYDGSGRPCVLVPPGPHCSVSARGDHAAFALSSRPVGIDIEPVVAGEIPWAVLADDEVGALRSLDEHRRPAAFLQIWTLKEAYLKARGSGLLSDPAAITVSASTLTMRIGGRVHRLHASTLHKFDGGGQHVVAACVALTDP